MSWRAISGGVTAPTGFQASATSCGIKVKGRRDLALIVSDRPALVAGMLTTNRLAAAPVHLCRTILQHGQAQAIIANSGNANACTGIQGQLDAETMAVATARALQVKPGYVLVASTGVIGRPMPMRRILAGIPEIAATLSPQGSRAAAEAIMTTDLTPKEAAVECSIDGKRIRIGGIAKGSGMINPAMATMFAFLATDAAITPVALRQGLRQAVESSFNAITVDGDMSTNDTVLLLANGAAGNRLVQPGKASFTTFTKALTVVCETLARAIVRDGEGASRFIAVDVRGAASIRDAQRAARTIANSPLVKTMVAGRDPNWGRVAAAVGASRVRLDPHRLTIALGGITVFQHAQLRKVNPLHLKRAFGQPEISILVHLGAGASKARVWTCDLTEAYVRINAKYTT